MGITTRVPIYLRVLKVPELPLTSVSLCVKLARYDGSSSVLVDHIRQSFLHWLSSGEHSYVVFSGSVFRFDLDTKEAVHAVAEVQYDADEAFSVEQLEGNVWVV